MASQPKFNTYQVKGSSLRSKLAFVAERFGIEGEAALVDFLAARGVLRILESAWYPFALYDDLNREIADRFFGGSLARLVEVGRYSAELALTTVYRAYAKKQDFHRFLTRISSLHDLLYSIGTSSVAIAEDGTSCEIRLQGAPVYPESDLYIAQGFYAGSAEQFGLDDVRCHHQVEPDGVCFYLSWR